jgi:hypothetical protein
MTMAVTYIDKRVHYLFSASSHMELYLIRDDETVASSPQTKGPKGLLTMPLLFITIIHDDCHNLESFSS